jgi:hypothetical protein
MGRFLTLMVLMILGTMAVRTQDDKPNPGQVWRNMPHDVKVSYAAGVTDGLTEGLSWCGPTGRRPAIAGNSTNDEVVKEIDTLYEDEANVSLPIIIAYRYAHMKLTGATEQRLNDFLGGIRGANHISSR